MLRASRNIELDQKTSLKFSERSEMAKFKRPENLEFPHVYYTFRAEDKRSDNLVEYRVQDLPEEFYEQTVDLMAKHFLPDETFCMRRDVANKPSAVQVHRDFWFDVMKQKMSIGCFKNDGSDELVAANLLVISSIDDPEFDTKGVSENI